MLWPKIFERGVEIGFAYKPFKWANHAKHNAGVTVVIIGLQKKGGKEKKKLFYPKNVRCVDTIGPYLVPNTNTIVKKRSKPLSALPEMLYGSKPVDDGNLFLSPEEYKKIISDFPIAKLYLKKAIGSQEFIEGTYRWCIWVTEENQDEASQVPAFVERFNRIKAFRAASVKPATQKISAVPFRFGEPRYSQCGSILIPRHSSERREYLPFGFIDNNTVILDSAQAIYDPEPWVLGVVCSRMHNVWIRVVGGGLEERPRYSSVYCYNPFPFPEISSKQRENVESHVWTIISERERHSDRTIKELYDPDLMPEDLLEAHRALDASVERCYRDKPFADDEERILYLFELYDEFVTADKKGPSKKRVGAK